MVIINEEYNKSHMKNKKTTLNNLVGCNPWKTTNIQQMPSSASSFYIEADKDYRCSSKYKKGIQIHIHIRVQFHDHYQISSNIEKPSNPKRSKEKTFHTENRGYKLVHKNAYRTLRPFPGTEEPQLWQFVCFGHKYGPWPTFCTNWEWNI